LLDQPGERRSHSVATPRGGGIAIVISLLVTAGAPTTGSARAAKEWGDGQATAELRGALIHAVARDGRAAGGWPC
ncbi:hypothetical protein C7E17_24315, partial [Stenotrophomonas maltophilia]